MSFKIEFNKATVDLVQGFINSAQDAFIQEAKNISEQLGVSESCGIDILYLRGRSRWTQELEDRLIELYKQGSPPNICEFE
jgi:hypothetical protein